MLNQIIKPVDQLDNSVENIINQQEVRNYIKTYFPTRSEYELKELCKAFHIISDKIETAYAEGLSYCLISIYEFVDELMPRSVSVTTDMRLFNDIKIELKNKGYDYTFVSLSQFDKDPKFIAISLNNNNDNNEEMYDEIRNMKNQYKKNDYKVIAAISLIAALISLIFII